MGEYYTYQKKRREYGKFCSFQDTEIRHLLFPVPRDNTNPNPNAPNPVNYIQRDPNFIDLDNIPELTEHVVNTERVNTTEKGMAHKEGGIWPVFFFFFFFFFFVHIYQNDNFFNLKKIKNFCCFRTGWPSTVNDPSESTETNKFRKRVERDPNFTGAVKELCSNVENCLKQNNQIDLFEEYFYEEESEHFVENISTKTLMLFKYDSLT